ncbi:phage tail protein I [Jeotgalibacillus terrae]|uniref:Phage tail protein I n=1 Tax=Jeotgalibacillus terrae TaxID=587735 RepID=A0ABW5ZGI7_9BACL|nr:phage tail protein I [Jeotgalibacillus terrae]MBM7579998.1 phage tail P2-like protein [Jeotgalibacillus terrae]
MIDFNNFSLTQLLPQPLKSSKQDQAMAAAITVMMQRVNQELEILDPFSLPEALLDIIAIEEHVDFYDPSLSANQKAELINNAFYFHQRKATPAAVEDLITIVFGEGQVVEWFEYGAQPGYFKVTTNNPAVTNEQAAEFIRALNSVKRKSSWLDVVELSQVEKMNLYFGGVSHTGDNITLRQVT